MNNDRRERSKTCTSGVGIDIDLGCFGYRARPLILPNGSSVTNKYGQVWDTPNVFVTGAALYPQNPGFNPTGTLLALAYYTADAIKRVYLRDPERVMG